MITEYSRNLKGIDDPHDIADILGHIPWMFAEVAVGSGECRITVSVEMEDIEDIEKYLDTIDKEE